VKIVGRYELLDPIGHGAMAVVYLARQIDLDREVALKELRMLQAPDDPALAERFLREARMAGSMSHPNIVTVHEYFKHEDTPYIAMEYLRRGSLRQWVGRMTVAQIAGVLEGLLAALDHAERHRIVHRDLKPENLLVTEQGQIKVADFGIAKAKTMNTNALLTKEGLTVGTPAYMAPEQAMAQDLGPHTDLYSVGIIAYELLVGQVPFHDTDTPVGIVLRHVSEEIPPAHTVNAGVDRALSDWIDRLLIKDPAQRTQTAEQAWDALEEVVLRLLGSRWRRDARLQPNAEQPAVPPLTPAAFTSTGVETPVPDTPPDAPLPETPPDEFASFRWGEVESGAPEARRITPAADQEAVAPPMAAVGPEAVAPEAVDPDPEPEAEPDLHPIGSEPGFVTFAEPAPVQEKREPAHQPVQPFTRAEPVPASAAEREAARTVMPVAVPEPARPPERPTSAAIHRRRRGALLGGGAALFAVAGVGVVLAGGGGSGGSSEATPANPGRTIALQNDDIALAVPTSWSKRSVPAITGLDPQQAVAAGPKSGGAYVAAELVSGRADPTLLPPKLLAVLKGRRPKAVAITLTGVGAYRYDRLRPRGSARLLRAYGALTTGGVATVVCTIPADAGATIVRDCDQIAQKLKLKSARGLPVGPSARYRAILNKTFASLDAAIEAARLRRANSPRTVTAQAAAQREFARAFKAAVASLEGANLNALDAGLNAKLSSAYEKAASAWRQFERALRRNDRAARTRARRALNRAKAAIDDAVATIRSVGYTAERRKMPRSTIPPPPPVAPPPDAPARPPMAPPPPPAAPVPPPPAGGGGAG